MLRKMTRVQVIRKRSHHLVCPSLVLRNIAAGRRPRQIGGGIDAAAIDVDHVVGVTAGAIAGRAFAADNVAPLHAIPDADRDLGQMGVKHAKDVALPVAALHRHPIAETATIPAGNDHLPGNGGMDRRTATGADICPGVKVQAMDRHRG